MKPIPDIGFMSTRLTDMEMNKFHEKNTNDICKTQIFT